jgi:hypothetical protein
MPTLQSQQFGNTLADRIASRLAPGSDNISTPPATSTFHPNYQTMYNRMAGSATVRANNPSPPFISSGYQGKHRPTNKQQQTTSNTRNANPKLQNVIGKHSSGYIPPGTIPPGLPPGSKMSVNGVQHIVTTGPRGNILLPYTPAKKTVNQSSKNTSGHTAFHLKPSKHEGKNAAFLKALSGSGKK